MRGGKAIDKAMHFTQLDAAYVALFNVRRRVFGDVDAKGECGQVFAWGTGHLWMMLRFMK
jgi:hypothetical protein